VGTWTIKTVEYGVLKIVCVCRRFVFAVQCIKNKLYEHFQSSLFTNECTSDCLKNSIKIYFKIALTCFGEVTPSSGSALSVLAKVTLLLDGFGGLVVSMLASGSRVRGFKPGQSRWIFLYIKILSMPSFGGEVK
jgi:hypothetical protein